MGALVQHRQAHAPPQPPSPCRSGTPVLGSAGLDKGTLAMTPHRAPGAGEKPARSAGASVRVIAPCQVQRSAAEPMTGRIMYHQSLHTSNRVCMKPGWAHTVFVHIEVEYTCVHHFD